MPPPIAVKPEDVIRTPAGEALERGRKENGSLNARSLPQNLATRVMVLPFKILTLKGMVVILYELYTTYRPIFTDGRELPKDANPIWTGYSVGKWDSDTLVVDTTGFHGAETILPDRHPHSDALHIIASGAGTLDTWISNSQSTTRRCTPRPWSFKEEFHLAPDTELLEYVCNENEQDLKHMVNQR